MPMQGTLSKFKPEERFLCYALADDPSRHQSILKDLWCEIGDDVAWEFACRHEAEGIVAIALSIALTWDMPRRWHEARGNTAVRIAVYMSELDRVAAALAQAGIQLVALKNSGIARGIYPDLAGCPMGDIDVLVARSDFRRAHEIMKQLGFSLGDRSPFELPDIESAEQQGGAEYTIQLKDRSILWFELQWRPVAGRWIRPDQEPPAEQLLARSVAIEGTAARLLVPEDNLLQVCLHTAKHTYVRAPGFRLHTDVDRIVRRCTINWDAFCSQVEKIEVRTAVYISLRIPAELLGTPVPAAVLRRLDFAGSKHSFMLGWLHRVGLFGPNDRKWSKLGYIGFNLLLYDTIGGMLRAIFPDANWMIKRYQIRQRWALPYWYLHRMFELLVKRART